MIVKNEYPKVMSHEIVEIINNEPHKLLMCYMRFNFMAKNGKWYELNLFCPAIIGHNIKELKNIDNLKEAALINTTNILNRLIDKYKNMGGGIRGHRGRFKIVDWKDRQ